IGTDFSGTRALANGAGVVLFHGAKDNTIGGTVSGAGNLIAGNDGVYTPSYSSNGVVLGGTNTSGNVVLGNLIGTDGTGTAALGNSVGVALLDGTHDNTVGGTAVGTANVISGNTNQGVYLNGSGTFGNVVLGNRIGTDRTGTAALGNGGDGVLL